MTEEHEPDFPSANIQNSNEPTDDINKESVDDSNTNPIASVWNQTTGRLIQVLPVEKISQSFVKWFSVSEAQVAEILEQVRAELPTTEALLIGKPQAGKVPLSGD